MSSIEQGLFQILPAEAGDLPDIISLIHAAFAEHRLLVPPSSADKETEVGLRAVLGHGTVFKAVAAGLIGCVVAERRPGRLYLGRLAVAPAWRRRGVAQGLLAAVEGFARGAGVTLLELNVRLVLRGNIRLFEGAGFRIVGQRCHPGFTVPTYHVMHKRLE